MKQQNSITYISLFFVALFSGIFLYWFYFNPVADFVVSTPGKDGRLDANADTNVIIGNQFTKFADLESQLTGTWPCFRGVDADNISKDNIKLIDKWPSTGPNILWKADLGEGHAAPVIWKGRAYILDYDEKLKADMLRCFNLETGKELWRRWYVVNLKRNHGMSRTVPYVCDNYIITIGPRCHVMCVHPISGDLLWGIDMVKEFNTEVPLWYTGQCPMVKNDTLIIAPGGNALFAAIDCNSGKIIWKTENPDNYKMSHSSIALMNLKGVSMYVYASIGGICGIDMQGNMLWKNSAFNPSVIAPTPIQISNNQIFLTAGYGAGAVLLEIVESNNKYNVLVKDIYKPQLGMASEQQTPILYKNHLFTIMPKDAGSMRNQFVCAHPDNPKNILWTSSKTERFGLGPYLIADGKFYILNDDGNLSIVKAKIDGFKLLDKAKVLDGHDAWGPIALADGYLLVRDSKQLRCIDIKLKL